MSDNNIISSDNLSIKIVLSGTSHVTFTPADSNAGVAGTPFNAGSKPFLVAGGKLNIRGWDASEDEGTATWTPLLDMAEGDRPTPTLSAEKRAVSQVNNLRSGVQCPRQLVNHDFDSGIDYSLWSGGDGGVLTHNAEEGTMVLTNIKKDWQGFRLDFTKIAQDCPIIEGQDYLVTMKLKIDKPGVEKGESMQCEITNDRSNDCPWLSRKMYALEGSNRGQNRRVS